MRLASLFLTAALATAIVAPAATPAMARGGWVKDAVQPDQVDQDLIACQYEAKGSTASIGLGGPPPKTTGAAINDGIAAGIVAAIEQHDLIKSCMRARGYSHPKYGAATN